MRFDRSKLNELSAWILVFCAFLTTILVARRELVPSLTVGATTGAAWKAIYVDGWEDALAVGIRSGSADAPVQIVEFADFQCPYCARFEVTVQAVLERYPEQVAFTFAPFPLPYHEYAENAQRVAECAYSEGRFDEMRSLLFSKQQAFGSVVWTDLAMQVGIEDVSRFDTCVSATEPLARIKKSRLIADNLGVRGTPTIIVNGWKLPMAPSSEHVDKMVTNVVEGRSPVAGIDFLATAGRTE